MAHLGPLPLFPPILPTGGPEVPKKLDDLAKKDDRASLKQLIKDEGTDWNVDEATAVALAESGGRAGVFNGSCCYGLFQINIVHLGEYGSPTDKAKWIEWVKDPRNNIRMAHAVWKAAGGTFLRDWDTYKNGAYHKFMGKDKVITVDKNSLVGDAVDSVGNAVLGPLDSFFSAITSADTWFRVGKTGVGGVFIVLGAATLLVLGVNKAASTPVGKTINTLKP